MNKLIACIAAASLVATPALAKLKAKDLIIGGIVGAVVMDAVRDAKHNGYYNSYNYNYSYSGSYNTDYNRNDPCYYTPSPYTYRNSPEQAEYERGRAARLCQELQERKQRAYECGYNGAC